jgi:hypothetical protein
MRQQRHNGPSMPPMQAIAMAHWQFWATAMAVYLRASISMVGSPLNAMTIRDGGRRSSQR